MTQMKIGLHRDVAEALFWHDGAHHPTERYDELAKPTIVKMVKGPLPHDWDFFRKLVVTGWTGTYIDRRWWQHYHEKFTDDFSSTLGNVAGGNVNLLVDFYIEYLLDCIDKGREWFAQFDMSLDDYLPMVYFESFNEVHGNAITYNAFETLRQYRMAELGLGACIGNFSVGTPDYHEWVSYLPMLEAAHDYGNILGVHEYGGMTQFQDFNNMGFDRNYPQLMAFPNIKYNHWGHLVGRYRWVWQNVIEPNGLTNVRIATTEGGFDHVADAYANQFPELTGEVYLWAWPDFAHVWNLMGFHDPIRFYADQLIHLNKMYNQDPFFVGTTIFTDDTIGTSFKGHDYSRTYLKHYLINYANTLDHLPVADPRPKPVTVPFSWQVYGQRLTELAKWYANKGF